MERRSYSLPEESHHPNDMDIQFDFSSCDILKRDAQMERTRTSPTSRRRGVHPDAVMPVQRQSSRDHVNHHVAELPDLREEEPQAIEDDTPESYETRTPYAQSSMAATIPARRSRRSSAPPTLLEPIQEGLFGRGRRNSTPIVMQLPHRRESSLSPARCGDSPPARSPRLGDKFSSPMYGITPEEDLVVRLQRRRRSEPDPNLKGLQSNILYTTEGFFPQPRRNSLATSTLNDIASRFELLNTRRKVVEEGESGGGPDMPTGGSLSHMIGCEGGARAAPPYTVGEAHSL